MGWYNLTGMTVGNQTGIGTFIQSTSGLVTYGGQHITGTLICFILFVVFFAFLKSKGYSSQASYVSGAWISCMAAIILQPIGLISVAFTLLFIILCAFGYIMLFWFQTDD